MLAFNQNIGSAIHKACAHNTDNDGVSQERPVNTEAVLVDPARTVSAPSSILALVSMTLNGPNIQKQSSHSSVTTPTLIQCYNFTAPHVKQILMPPTEYQYS